MDPVAFVVAESPVTWTELIGDATALACVYLVARANPWNWPLGIANAVLFFFVFARARLYGNALLQIVFALLNAYGWWAWTHGGALGGELPVRRATQTERAVYAVTSVAGTAAAALILAQQTDSPAPTWDAAVLVLSLLATWAQAEKVVESWWLWLAVDAIAVPLYLSRALYPTALLYAFLLGLCVMGLREWLRLLREQAPVPVTAS